MFFCMFCAKNEMLLEANTFYVYIEIKMQRKRKQLQKLRERNADQGYVNFSRTFRVF